MRVKPIQELLKDIIAERRQKLNAEIELYEQKMSDTEQYWGLGGAYRRQEAAADKRREQLEELDRFEYQMNHTVNFEEITVYPLYCRHCSTAIMCSAYPKGEWHECPCCKQMIYENAFRKKELKVAHDGHSFMQAFKQEMKGEEEDW